MAGCCWVWGLGLLVGFPFARVCGGFHGAYGPSFGWVVFVLLTFCGVLVVWFDVPVVLGVFGGLLVMTRLLVFATWCCGYYGLYYGFYVCVFGFYALAL